MPGTVQELLDAVIEAVASDADRLRELCDDDVLVLGTDPGEEYDGVTEAVDAMRQQAQAIGPARWLSEGDRRLRQRSDVAWFAEHGRLDFGARGGARVRLTGVAVQGPDGWRVAQAQVAPCEAPAAIA